MPRRSACRPGPRVKPSVRIERMTMELAAMQVGPRPKPRWERRSPTWSVSSRRPGSATPAGALWATQESVFRCGCRLNSTWWRSSPDLPEAVARRANVSRSWLYLQPDIRAEVERLRDLGRRAPETAVPARQRSTDSSLLRRLQAANARNRELAEDNQRLRRQLAHALGQRRADPGRDEAEQSPSPRRGVSLQ